VGDTGEFGPEGEEVTGSWRKFHYDEQLSDFYSSPNIIAVIKWSEVHGIGICHAWYRRQIRAEF
jgi:hypothetical protein